MLDCRWVTIGLNVLIEDRELADVHPDEIESVILGLGEGTQQAAVGGGVAEGAWDQGDSVDHFDKTIYFLIIFC